MRYPEYCNVLVRLVVNQLPVIGKNTTLIVENPLLKEPLEPCRDSSTHVLSCLLCGQVLE
jgi:hypothetical protein